MRSECPHEIPYRYACDICDVWKPNYTTGQEELKEFRIKQARERLKEERRGKKRFLERVAETQDAEREIRSFERKEIEFPENDKENKNSF